MVFLECGKERERFGKGLGLVVHQAADLQFLVFDLLLEQRGQHDDCGTGIFESFEARQVPGERRAGRDAERVL